MRSSNFLTKDDTLKLYRRTSVSREYVSTECNFRRISVIVHRSASDELARRWLTRLACLWTESVFLQRGRKSVWQIVSNHVKDLWMINSRVSGKLSKYLYVHGYTHLITSSALNECLLVHNFPKQLLHRMTLITRNAKENRSMTVQ